MMLIVEPAVMTDPASKKYPELFEEHKNSLITWTVDDKGVLMWGCLCGGVCVGVGVYIGCVEVGLCGCGGGCSGVCMRV